MRQILCVFLCVFCLSELSSIDANSDDYKVTIIHANDLYSAFAGVKPDNSLCDINDDLNHCIGGAPKIVAKIRELRSKEFVVFVNSGNNLGGFWYKQFGPKVVSDFFSELQFDVIALGLSDFQLGSKENKREGFDNITQFLSSAATSSRIVSCNIQAPDKTISNFYSSVRKYATIGQFSRHKIGVIGFAKPPDTSLVDGSAFDYLDIEDPIKCLQEESEKLRRIGHEIILAVGSGDQDLFKEIAANVPLVDVVIGGYGFTKDLSLLKERSVDNYPDFVYNGSNGDRIVVTADTLGKSVGKLSLIFNSNGNIKSSEGTLIRIDEKIEDSDINTNTLVSNYQKALFIGYTSVYLNGIDCSTRECNLGNLITDSLIFYHDTYIKPTLVKERANGVLTYERDVIALINSKTIESSIGDINTHNTRNYSITKISLDKVFVRGSPKIRVVNLMGKTIRQLLEDYFKRSDMFQVSALRVSYDRSNDKIIEISVKCSDCSDNSYKQLNETKLYEVLLPQNIQINGFNDSIQVVNDLSAFHVLEEYIREKSPINTKIQNRITLIGGKSDAFGAKTQILMTLFSTLIAVCHLRYYN